MLYILKDISIWISNKQKPLPLTFLLIVEIVDWPGFDIWEWCAGGVIVILVPTGFGGMTPFFIKLEDKETSEINLI